MYINYNSIVYKEKSVIFVYHLKTILVMETLTEKKYVITLKNLKHYPKLSDDSNAFSADVYINGVKVGDAKDDGNGGEIDFYSVDGQRNFVREVEKYFLSLPKKKLVSKSSKPIFGDDIMIQPNFYTEIGNLVYEDLVNKDKLKIKKKFEKDCKKGICVGTSDNYDIYYWKNRTLLELLTIPKGVEAVKKRIKEIQKEGKTILNTNIPKELF